MKSVFKTIIASVVIGAITITMSTASAFEKGKSMTDWPLDEGQHVKLLTDFELGDVVLPGNYTDSDINHSDDDAISGFKQLRKLNSKHFI